MSWLIVCCDGTWNAPEMASVTNVRRLHSLLDKTDTQQAFYASGVGTTGSMVDRIDAGTTGSDLDAKILDAYRWLVTRYAPGDEIALFGFSRGAYTVRSLSGLVSYCGLLDPDGLDAATLDAQIHQAYADGYREQKPGWRHGLHFCFDPDSGDIPVRFIGVWDTVGALGIPGNLGWLQPANGARYAFHDVALDARVHAARHAVALDEMRGPFTPTLWDETKVAPEQDVAQVWFAGSHMDVGGGHLERGLPDITLDWMLGEVRALTTISITDPKPQITPDPLDVVHDDDRNQLGPGLSLLLDAPLDRISQILWDSRPRRSPPIDAIERRPDVHSSVYDRQEGRPITSGRYRPTQVLARRGDTATVEIAAEEPWNDTGLYLEPGWYRFSATGEWRDGTAWTRPGGAARNPLTELSVAVGQVVRMAAQMWTGQDHPDWTLVGERRGRHLPPMRLVGVVANDDAPRPLDAVASHQIVDIGDYAPEVLVTAPGYLYAYANGAWGSYDDNAGAVRLTVRKATSGVGPEGTRRGFR